MRRKNHLFDACTTRDALYDAYLEARRGKRATQSCHLFERRLGAQIEDLHRRLRDGSYTPRDYRTFQVCEPKPRIIHAPAFRDRVVQHAVYKVALPLYEPTFISASFACRPGLGTHKASLYLLQALRACRGDDYVLQLDVRRFFYSIDRDILQSLLARRLKDARLLALMAQFARMDSPLGIPIGNLLSQMYALIYLTPVDHHIKRALRVRHYARYVDDLVLVGLSRDAALEHREAIAHALAGLGLGYSKTSVHRVRRGVNFCGYRTWRSGRWVRKRAIYNYRRALRRNDRAAVVSLLGHAKLTRSLQHMESMQRLAEAA